MRFWKADVFSAGEAAGVPAACLLSGRETLPDQRMQAAAAELKGFVEEVGFAAPAGDGLALRGFAPARERTTWGPSALTALTALDGEGLLPAGGVTLRVGRRTYRADRLPAGGWAVDAPSFTVGRLTLWQDDVLRALRMEPLRLHEEYGMALMEGDARVLLVPMHTAAALCDLQPDEERMANLTEAERLDSILVYTGDRIRPSSDYRTRVFSPRLGIGEEAASVAANGALARFLLARGHWQGGRLTVEQGREYRAPNLIAFTPGRDTDTLRVEGGIRLRLAGEYLL